MRDHADFPARFRCDEGRISERIDACGRFRRVKPGQLFCNSGQDLVTDLIREPDESDSQSIEIVLHNLRLS